MSTVTWRDGVLAGDTLVSDGGTRWGRCPKVTAGPGVAGGAVGPIGGVAAFLAWVRAGATGELPAVLRKLEGFEGLLFRGAGPPLYVDGLGPAELVKPERGYLALGSGTAFALGAMTQGATARRAVEVAAMFDPSTGGPVDAVILSDLGG